jgi:hypothetical protein
VDELNQAYSSVGGVLFDKSHSSLIAFPGGWRGIHDEIYGVSWRYDVPDGVASIGDHAFSGFAGPLRVTLPDSLTSIGEGAFADVKGMWVISIPNNVASIGPWAFRGCSGLRIVSIPSKVTSIAVGTFYGCADLFSVAIPDGVTSIGARAFYECRSLMRVTLPRSVTSIGPYAFYGCTDLNSATLSEGVISIGDKAFYECRSLTRVTLPDSVTFLGDAAFHPSTFLVGRPNLAPLTVDDVVSVTRATSVRIPVATLLGNDSDPDGDTVVVDSVAPFSAAGGRVQLRGLFVVYTPPEGGPATDTFVYTAGDGFGGLTTATVQVTLTEPEPPEGSALSLSSMRATPQSVVLDFVGIRGRRYRIERSPNMQPPWTGLGTATADEFGRFRFEDTSPLDPMGFYRIVRVTGP